MTKEEIPPYQAIDIICNGKHHSELDAPVKGYVVTFPDRNIDAVMLSEEEATPQKLDELKSLSKYPKSIFFRECWMHTQQTVFDEITNRKHWSIR